MILRGLLEEPIYWGRGEMPKMGAGIVCRFKRWLLKKEGVDVFEVELRPQCTLWVEGAFLLTQIFKQ